MKQCIWCVLIGFMLLCPPSVCLAEEPATDPREAVVVADHYPP
ncbi:hypothetical protein [Pseudodesulfovibrio sp. JC047]|nr:hypothetical protein [Pseudodesulfovibrio sp. JC047]